MTDDYIERLRAAAEAVGAVLTLARVGAVIEAQTFTLTTDHPFLANAFREADRLGLGTARGSTLTVHPGEVVPLRVQPGTVTQVGTVSQVGRVSGE